MKAEKKFFTLKVGESFWYDRTLYTRIIPIDNDRGITCNAIRGGPADLCYFSPYADVLVETLTFQDLKEGEMFRGAGHNIKAKDFIKILPNSGGLNAVSALPKEEMGSAYRLWHVSDETPVERIDDLD